MDPQVTAAYIAGGAALLGGLLAGGVALLTQRIGRRAEMQRWNAEAAERAQARFHDVRVRTYTEFLAQSRMAARLSMKIAQERRGKATGEDGVTVDLTGLDGYSAQDLYKSLGEVLLVAASPEVRKAAQDLTPKIWSYTAIQSDAPDFGERLGAAIQELDRARTVFIEAARKELTVAGNERGVDLVI
jgi:hypothetical protein